MKKKKKKKTRSNFKYILRKECFRGYFCEIIYDFPCSFVTYYRKPLLLPLSGWGEIGSALLNLIWGDDYCLSRKPQVTWVTK